jgi:hypothetical protein
MRDETEFDAPLEPERPDEAGPDQESRDHPDTATVPEVLTREGADAPDAADIEDPDEQL